MRVLLIDADTWLYTIGHHARQAGIKYPSDAQLEKDIRSILYRLCEKAEADSYALFLGGSRNWRADVYKVEPYKGNRPPLSPQLIMDQQQLTRVLTEKFSAYVTSPMEADDMICYAAHQMRKHSRDYVICSKDKDLLQIPGKHLNTKPGPPILFVEESEAISYAWKQVLTGDATDNIVGIPGIGDKKASKLLEGKQEHEMRMIVQEQYKKYYGSFYGPQIFQQTVSTVFLMTPYHPNFITYSHVCQGWYDFAFKPVNKPDYDTILAESLTSLL